MRRNNYILKKLISGTTAALVLFSVVPEALPLQRNIINVEAASEKISAKKLTLAKGQSQSLKIKGTKKKVKWTSSNKKVASVSSKGKVKAKAKGKATIIGKIGKKKYKCKVTVETPCMNIASRELRDGQSLQLYLKGTKQKVTWKSDNTPVATVSSKGKVQALSPGVANISARIGNKSYFCRIFVTEQRENQIPDPVPVPTPAPKPDPKPDQDKDSEQTESNGDTVLVNKIELDFSELSLFKGDVKTLRVNTYPSNAIINQRFVWESSDENIAIVSEGMIFAQGIGDCIITVHYGELEASCNVTVDATTAQRFDMLKDYILENGEINSDGNKRIKISGKDTGYTVLYNSLSGNFEYNMYSDLGGTFIDSLTMIINPRNIKNANIKYMYLYDSKSDFIESEGYKMTAILNLASYTGDEKIKFTTVTSVNSNSYNDRNNRSNNMFIGAFKTWNRLFMKDQPWGSFNDFGFAFDFE